MDAGCARNRRKLNFSGCVVAACYTYLAGAVYAFGFRRLRRLRWGLAALVVCVLVLGCREVLPSLTLVSALISPCWGEAWDITGTMVKGGRREVASDGCLV